MFKGILTELHPSELIPFFKRCLMKENEAYDLVFHNCRNFVCEVFEELEKEEKITKEVSRKFSEDMAIVKKEDEKKVIHYIRIQAFKLALFGWKYCRFAKEKFEMIRRSKK